MGQSQSTELVILFRGDGLAAYRIVISSSDPAIANIVNVTPIHPSLRAVFSRATGEIELVGEDLLSTGDSQVDVITVASFEITGFAPGTALIDVIDVSILDLSGQEVQPDILSATVDVYVNCPSSADLDGDGKCEDVNGDGQVDFDDVLTMFEVLADNSVPDDQVYGLDFNDNGRLDFADLVTLYRDALQ